MAKNKNRMSGPYPNGDGVRWEKMYKGTRWKSKTHHADTRDNERLAWQEFCEWRDTQDQETPKSKLKKQLKEVVSKPIETQRDFARIVGNREAAKQAESKLQEILQSDSLPELAALLKEMVSQNDTLKEVEEMQLMTVAQHQKFKPQNKDTTAGHHVDRLLKQYENKVNKKQLSAARYAKVKHSLDFFLDWYGSDRDITEMSSLIVEEYFNFLLDGLNGTNDTTFSDHWSTFKMFVDDCGSVIEEMPVPKNLRSRKYKIERNKHSATAFTVDEIQLLLDNTGDRNKLFFLLMLNCGMTQKDVADLQADEVNWKEGRITRKRSKTKKQKTVPTVNYPLWDQTFDLLKKFGNQEGLVFLNENQNPLWSTGIKDNGTIWKNDAIKNAYFRLIKKLKAGKKLPQTWKKSLKAFRSTGGDMIFNSPHKAYLQEYLGHAPTGVAENHYVVHGKSKINPDFDKAVLWLGKALKIVK